MTEQSAQSAPPATKPPPPPNHSVPLGQAGAGLRTLDPTPVKYAELHCHSYFSLLDGASAPEALINRAVELGLTALALTDHDNLSGAIRFYTAAQRASLHPVIGAEVTLADGHHLTLLAETQAGYANLCRLLTAARLDQIDQLNPLPLSASQSAARQHLDKFPSSPRERGSGDKVWPGKVTPALTWTKLAAHASGIICLSGCQAGPVAAPLLQHQPQVAQANTQRLLEIFGREHFYLELQHHYRPTDVWLIGQLLTLAQPFNLAIVATNNVHYATAAHSQLHDALSAIRYRQTLTAARQAGHLPLNHNAYLAAPAELQRRFSGLPQALHNTVAIAQRCQVSLDFSHQRLPTFSLPYPVDTAGTVGFGAFATTGRRPPTEFEYLYQLCHTHLPHRYPQLTPQVLKQLAHELDIIARAGLAGYFLIVWDIVRFAREQGIRCQGRGSAANSLVAYLLQITNIDPLRHNLLFERFLSEDRFTMPDIDIDFAADRREEVIQYVYQKYGHEHTAMVCNVVTYQARSALRDLAKALAFPPAVSERLAQKLDTPSCQTAADQLESELASSLASTAPRSNLSTGSQLPTLAEGWGGTDRRDEPGGAVLPASPGSIAANQPNTSLTPPSPLHPVRPSSPHPLRLLLTLLRQIDGCPRHLSIHTGGLVITAAPLTTLVPLEPATLPGRIIVQWDKDSLEDAGLIKIDLLGLRTLSLITDALQHIQAHTGHTPDLAALPLDDPNLYRLLHQADTIGAFQVESRAQQQMLPRLRPTCFTEIAIQIAIIRPGPIQGGAVHPYLRRHAGLEPVRYLHPTLEPVLAETLGVLLFQEQAIRLAMQVAGFSTGAADLLRRALARKDAALTLPALAERFVHGAQSQGLDPATAQAIFAQLAGFAGYGFCKSHAMSFALIAYQTLYLKHYYPAAFYCALLNQQPMGFYSPEVIINDAQRHGVTLLPPHVNHSAWSYTLVRQPTGQLALRTGLQAISAFGPHAYHRLATARHPTPTSDPLLTAPLATAPLPLLVGELVEPHPFTSLPDLCRRTRLPRPLITHLIRAGACDDWGDRRTLLWQLGDLTYPSAGLDLTHPATPVSLPALEPAEQTAWEYELLGYSPSGQLLQHYRPTLTQQAILTTAQAKKSQAGQRLRVAGLAVVRQRPPSANGLLFLSLEDETGLLDIVVAPELYDQCRDTLRQHPLLLITGLLQRNGPTVSLRASTVTPLTPKPLPS